MRMRDKGLENKRYRNCASNCMMSWRSACSIVLRCSCSCIHSMHWFIVWEVLHTPSNTIMLWQHSCEDASASMRCAAPLCYPLSQMPSNIIRLRLPSRSLYAPVLLSTDDEELRRRNGYFWICWGMLPRDNLFTLYLKTGFQYRNCTT